MAWPGPGGGRGHGSLARLKYDAGEDEPGMQSHKPGCRRGSVSCYRGTLGQSVNLSKLLAPQLQSREGLLHFSLSIKWYGGSVTWAGLLPDTVGQNPFQSPEGLPVPSLHGCPLLPASSKWPPGEAGPGLRAPPGHPSLSPGSCL